MATEWFAWSQWNSTEQQEQAKTEQEPSKLFDKTPGAPINTENQTKMNNEKGTDLAESATNALFAIFNNPNIKYWWVKRIVKTIGTKMTLIVMADAFTIAYSNCCPITADGSRKKDLGGVIMELLHSKQYMTGRRHVMVFGNLRKYK